VTTDAAYGSAKYPRCWLEQRDQFHVLAIRGKDDVVIGFSQPRAAAVIAKLPTSAWQRLSVGAGSHGPRRSSLTDLAWIAGTRWKVEDCFQQVKNIREARPVPGQDLAGLARAHHARDDRPRPPHRRPVCWTRKGVDPTGFQANTRMVTLVTPKTTPGQTKLLPASTQNGSPKRQRAMMDAMNPTALVKLESGLSATGQLTLEELGDPNIVKGWELLGTIDPVFRLVFDDGSDFEVHVNPGFETGAFELTEYAGRPIRKATLAPGFLP
jgi:hypothetical protein